MAISSILCRFSPRDEGIADLPQKKIVILSHGTGNAVASVWRANVWRLFQSIDLTGDQEVAIYDDGVGTSSFLPLALIGGALGVGLKRNIIDLYEFACRNYNPKDELLFFEFSRGAFTARVLAALILSQGLVKCLSESELDRLAIADYIYCEAANILKVKGCNN